MGPHKNEKVIPIADDGGGDFVCLDYRDGGTDPAVCYFQHELGELTPLAASFSDFCTMLWEPAD